jgi:hypothetical protein
MPTTYAHDLQVKHVLGSVPMSTWTRVYYNTALGTRAISNIISAGPNLTVIGSSGGAPGIMDYLSTRWFSTQWNT